MQKGFTLFTALVGALVIVVSVLLVSTMSSTQKNTVQLIEDSSVNQEMIDVANLSRADALQQFNFGIRNAFELYFRDFQNNYYTLREINWLNENTSDETIDLIVNDFEQQHLQDNFVEFSAGELIEKLCGNENVCNAKETSDYIIRISNFDKDKFKEIFREVLLFSHTEGTDKFVEVINCSADDCPQGTFYLNLDFSGLSNEQYELLPQIEVIKKSSCRLDLQVNEDEEEEEQAIDVPVDVLLDKCSKTLKLPVVPKAKMRILVPLRIFKAIVESRKIARSLFDEDSQVQKDLQNAKLGVCDSKRVKLRCSPPTGPAFCTYTDIWSCYPRNNPLASNALNYSPYSQMCVMPTTMLPLDPPLVNPWIDLGYPQVDSVTLESGGSYKPILIESVDEKLKEFVTAEILHRKGDEYMRNNLELIEQDGFEIIPDFTIEPQTFFWSPRIVTQAYDSRENSVNGGAVNSELTSRCTKIKEFFASIVFREKNPLYSISTNEDAPNRTVFRIEIENISFNEFGDTVDYTENAGFSCSSVLSSGIARSASCSGYVKDYASFCGIVSDDYAC